MSTTSGLSRFWQTRTETLTALSLRARLYLVFGLLAILAVSCAVLLLLEQHTSGTHATEIAMRAQRQMGQIVRLRESIAEIDRLSAEGTLPSAEIQGFHSGIDRLRTLVNVDAEGPDRELNELLDRLEQRFRAYSDALGKRLAQPGERGTPNGDAIKGEYEEIVAMVGALIEHSENLTLRKANQLAEKQFRSIQISLLAMVVFILILGFCGYKVISIITEPLSGLVRFLDGVDVEDDLPTELPHFRSQIPEIARVSRSFDELLSRLRGYRALNVHRLLIEKRRADIIAASINEGMVLLRGEEVLYVNPVAERMMGLSGVARGMSLQSLLPLPTIAGQAASRPRSASAEEDTPEARRKRMTQSCAKAILSAVSQTMPVDFTFEAEDGRKLYYLIQAYPISYDVIAQVEHSVGSLEEPVLDRFQANTLVVAQDVTLVRESQEAKGHFLATLSHEIKTPVTSLTMATRLLQKFIGEIPNPTHRNLIQTCVDDVDRLRRLLDELLTISRFDALTQRLAIQDVDLVKLIKHQIQSFQTQATERGLSLTMTTRGPEKSIAVPVDPSKVSWAISNLLTNALRHTPRGGRVETEIEVVNEWVEVRVRDSGPGIEKKRQSRIFDKFSPYYDIRVARSGSAGVGLSIAREIVVAHGGRIWVASEPGHGAEFCFNLPLKRGAATETDSKMIGTKGAYSGALARS